MYCRPLLPFACLICVLFEEVLARATCKQASNYQTTQTTSFGWQAPDSIRHIIIICRAVFGRVCVFVCMCVYTLIHAGVDTTHCRTIMGTICCWECGGGEGKLISGITSSVFERDDMREVAGKTVSSGCFEHAFAVDSRTVCVPTIV